MHLGIVHFVNKDYESALTAFNQASLLDPTLAAITSFKQEIKQQQLIQDMKNRLESATKYFVSRDVSA
jgi:hypothetical protein